MDTIEPRWWMDGYVVWSTSRVLIGRTNNPASRLIRDVFIPLTRFEDERTDGQVGQRERHAALLMNPIVPVESNC